MKFLLSLFCLLVASQTEAANYFVKTAGSDGANGLSNATAWATLAKVNGSSFSAGDTISLNRGDTWNEQLTPPSSGSPSNPIVFDAYGTGAKPLITNSTACLINGRSYITIQNLNLQGVAFGFRATIFQATGNGISILNNTASASNGAGILFTGNGGTETGNWVGTIVSGNAVTPEPTTLTHSGIEFTGDNRATGNIAKHTNFIIAGNTVGPAGEDGIIVENGVGGLITGNIGGGNKENSIDIKDTSTTTISYNICDNDQQYNIVVHDDDAETVPNNLSFSNIIEYNTMTRGGQGGTNPECLFMKWTDDTIIRYNDFGACFAGGIALDDHESSANNNQIYYNTIHGCNTGTVGGAAIQLLDVVGTKIWNNVIYGQLLNTRALDCVGGANTTGVQVRNNIIYQTASTNNTVRVLTACAPAFTSDYNIFFPDGATAFNFNGNMNFAAWKAASSGDSHSFTTDPLFANAPGNNFHLAPTSVGQNAGISVGLTRDLAAHKIKGAPEIGVFERGASSSMSALGTFGSTPWVGTLGF